MALGRSSQIGLIGLAMALAAFGGQPDQPKAAYLVKTDSQVELLTVNRGETKTVGKVGANWLSWNAPGTRLLLHAAPIGALWVWREGRDGMVEVAKAAESPRWSPDGAKALFRTPTGDLLVYVATAIGSEPLPIAKGVRCAEWSPDGSRIAFSTKDSIWICGASGENPRESLPGETALALTWSPTGRLLAYIEPGLGKGAKPMLSTAAVNGSASTSKAALDASALAWSPGGQFVAAETASGIEVLDIVKGKSVGSSAGIRGPITWSGSNRLVGVKNGVPVEYVIGDLAPRELTKLDQKGVIHAGVVPRLHLTEDMILSDPFRQATKPTPGQTALRGTVVAMEPLDEQFTIAIESTTGSEGERHFSRPIEQTVQTDPRTTRVVGGQVVPYRTIDLKIDDEVWVIVNATKLDEKAVLAATSITIAGDSLRDPALQPSRKAPHIRGDNIEYDGVSTEKVVVPMTFPVLGKVWYNDWFLAPRGGGTRRHHGQDLMAAKLTPLVACFDGTVVVGKARPGGHMTLRVRGTNGWTACYYHVNNDNPGTDDGMGGETYAFAPGLRTGQYVYEGQFIGYVGDSGNAETTAPHCHFELWDDRFGAVVNAYPSLRQATKIDEPRYVAPAPELLPGPGEMRIDGIVKKVDDAKETLKLELVAKYDRGRMRVVTRPAAMWGKIEPQSQLQVRGRRNVSLQAKDLRSGLQGTIVGVQPAKDRAIQTRIGAFEKGQ